MRKPLEDMSEDEARAWVAELRGRLQLKQARERNYLGYVVYANAHGVYIPTDDLIEVSGEAVEIPLAGKKVVLVDAELAQVVASKRWHARKDGQTFYACREEWPGGTQVLRYMHIILYEHVYGPVPANMEIDHKNGNGLDNRIGNLRLVTHRTNVQNNKRRREGLTASRCLGVIPHRQSQKWQARLGIGRKHYSLGYFDSEEEAGIACIDALVAYEQNGTLPVVRKRGGSLPGKRGQPSFQKPPTLPSSELDEAYEADQDLENDLLAILEHLERES